VLQHLLIKDLAVVAFADIHFSTGMTVITGETGAGKSILLDALHLALGQRSDSQLVRPGAERTEIAATFDISALPGAILWLADLELTGEPSQQCIIRRVLYGNGRSKAFINGRPVTTQQLRLLGDHLVQIHGQHQHQQLLKPAEQLRLLDAFGQHEALVSQVKTTYKQWEALQRRQQDLLDANPDQARFDLLQYQIAELESLELKDNELDVLYQEHDRLAHAQGYLQLAQNALLFLENDSGDSASHLLLQARQQLQNVSTGKLLQNAVECLDNAQIQLNEALHEIHHFADHIEINPERLSQVERRLERLHEMARKHKVEPAHLPIHFAQLQQQWEQLNNYGATIEQLTLDIALAHTQYTKYAQQLSTARAVAAEKLAQAVSAGVQQLAMQGAVFTVDLHSHSDNHPHAFGNESALFGISANPGHPPQPLQKVASGGELSRVSLALELITAQFLETPCLIFDEVDVGISGKTGALVGKALHNLSKAVQVLCITHLPQVAAFGDHHLQVVKIQSDSSTQSEIISLTKAQRVEEIARLLGGIDVSSQARAHAKTLLQHENA
jgi:DNA repair protein RecN (Recombination protein N)